MRTGLVGQAWAWAWTARGAAAISARAARRVNVRVIETSPWSGHGRGVEQHEGVVQLPLLGPGLLLAAGHVEHEAEELPAHVFDRGLAIGDAAGVDVHQVVPAACQVAAR